mmetsp:Transcript_14279/g.37048  ORF Transcript_14279/g.37048 Transcript_14279/m.37048 type:complete len:214 (+) Transcript_14279:1048-1689(+)
MLGTTGACRAIDGTGSEDSFGSGGSGGGGDEKGGGSCSALDVEMVGEGELDSNGSGGHEGGAAGGASTTKFRGGPSASMMTKTALGIAAMMLSWAWLSKIVALATTKMATTIVSQDMHDELWCVRRDFLSDLALRMRFAFAGCASPSSSVAESVPSCSSEDANSTSFSNPFARSNSRRFGFFEAFRSEYNPRGGIVNARILLMSSRSCTGGYR